MIGSGSSSDAVDDAGASDRPCIGHFADFGSFKLEILRGSPAHWGLLTSE